jgi:mannan endo-1,4-beta-mannosidase
MMSGGSAAVAGNAGAVNGGGVGGGAGAGGHGGGGTGPGKATPRQRLIDLFASISGKQTIAGQHNREPNAEPSKWTTAIEATTGKVPGLYSGDFLFQAENIRDRGLMIAEAKRQYAAGAVVNLMYHACPPTQGEACEWKGGVLSSLTDPEWTELLTDGSVLNSIWKSRLDAIAVYLEDLRRSGVAALFRPIHEMNQRAFWWGGRKGATGTRRLYQITHDYLTKHHGLDNLVWVWDVQDLSWDFAEYNPGPEYFDIAALDVYGNGYTQAKYDAMLKVAGGKPIAIGECQKLPTPAELAKQPRWVFFMPWAELVYEHNTEQAIRDLYSADRVLTRDELPGWK